MTADVEDCDAFTGTCDQGNCERPTAVVLLIDNEWTSACQPCALLRLMSERTNDA